MNFLKPISLACALLTLPVFLACGGGGGGSDPAPVVAVSLAPTTASVFTGGTKAFTAAVTGSTNTSVTWAIQEGAPGGTISAAGLYTAPATTGTFHVIATSVADTAKKATAIVTVTAAPVVHLTLTPLTATLGLGGTQTFTATVTGATNTAVTWTVQEGISGGSITNGGVYTAPMSAGTYHVTATPAADASKFVSATVTVVAPATGLAYTDPTTGSYRLLKDASSSGSHLVLNLVGPSAGTAMGVSITVTGDAHTSWVDVPAGGTTSVLMLNGGQFNLGAGTPILKAKATGNSLQATVAQKAPTGPAPLNGVLLQIALDLKANQSLVPGTVLTLTADGAKCQVLDAVGGAILPIGVSTGTLTAQ